MGDDASAPMFVTADTEDLRATGNDWLRSADRVVLAQHHVLMASASQYGGTGALAAAARRFEDRTSHAVQALAAEVEQVGHHLRGTAESYELMDTGAADDLSRLGTRLDGAS
jgi:hypothetical protein